MTQHINPLYPSLIFPLDGVVEDFSETQLCESVVLRNLDQSELDCINRMIEHEGGRFWGVRAYSPEVVCVEVRRPNLADAIDEHQKEVRQYGEVASEKALTLLRLVASGAVETRLAIAPLAETIPSAYTISHLRSLPGIVKPSQARPYRFTPQVLSDLQRLFTAHWKGDLSNVPGVRWLNKACRGLSDDEEIVHLVFGLEQLLLHEEKEHAYLSFKMAVRGAWLLASPDEREKVFKSLRSAYGLRSDIAHGSLARELTDAELLLANELFGLLRRTILLYLDDHTRFTPQQFNRLVLGLGSAVR